MKKAIRKAAEAARTAAVAAGAGIALPLLLINLEPHFMRIEDARNYAYVETIDEADGISFCCPKCFIANGGRPRTHSIICWRPKVSQDVSPRPGRWEFKGTGYDDLTLFAGKNSILLTGGCNAHFFIENGKVRMA